VTPDRAAILATIDARLPRRTRWLICGEPLDFDFSTDRYRLQRVTDSDVVGGPVPEEWSDCGLIGSEDFAEGGGASPWIAIRERDGFVCGLDIERDGETTFIYNSSLDRFIATFNLLDGYLRVERDLPLDLLSRFEVLDPEAFVVSEWRNLIDYVTAGYPANAPDRAD
jgi:hypothetical protein